MLGGECMLSYVLLLVRVWISRIGDAVDEVFRSGAPTVAAPEPAEAELRIGVWCRWLGNGTNMAGSSAQRGTGAADSH